jgi:hypothetical protein
VSSSTFQLRFPQKTVLHPSGFADASLGALIGFGVEYWMLSQRPSKSSPFNFMQASQDSEVAYLRMAVPELRPSSWTGNSRLVISPQEAKYCLTSSSVALQGNPLMNKVLFASSSSTAAFFATGASTSASALRFFVAGTSLSFVSSESESESEELLDELSLSEPSFLVSATFFSAGFSSSESESELELDESSFLATTFLAATASFLAGFSSDSESELSELELDESAFFAATFLAAAFFATGFAALEDDELLLDELLLLLDESESLPAASAAAFFAASAAAFAASTASLASFSASAFFAAFASFFSFFSYDFGNVCIQR